MAEVTLNLRTSYDGMLWDQLGPALVEHYNTKAGYFLDGRFETLEQAREAIGYLRGLRWVFDQAAELSKRP